METKISIILSALNHCSIEDILASAEKIHRYPLPEGMTCNVVVALPSAEKLPNGINSGIEFRYVSSEDDLYYRLPKMLDADFVSILTGDSCYTDSIFNSFDQTRKRYPNRSVYVCKLNSNAKNYSYMLNTSFKKRRDISVLTHMKRLWVNPEGALIRRNMWEQIKIPELGLKCYNNNLFFLQMLSLSGGFTLIAGASVKCGRTFEDYPLDKELYFTKEGYFDLLKAFGYLFAWQQERSEMVPAYFQYAFLYFLRMAFSVNFNANTKHIIKDDTLVEFRKQMNHVLSFVSDDILMDTSSQYIKLNANIRYKLLRQKYGDEKKPNEYWKSANEIALIYHGKQLLTASGTRMKIYLMELEKNILNISGTFPFPFDYNNFQLVAEFDHQFYPVSVSERFSYFKVFGEIAYRDFCFDVSIPLKLGCGDIRFYLVCGETKVPLDIKYAKPRALLGGGKTYYSKGKYLLYHLPRRIVVLHNTRKRRLRKELALWKYLYKAKKKDVLQLRILYFISHLFLKNKKIWIFYDKMFKGGDNGEYMFRYCRKQKDGVKKYYILRDDVVDAKRFREEGVPFVKYGSLKHCLLFLNATAVFTTHSNAVNFNSFAPGFENYFRDCYRFDTFCLQHGLSVQAIPNLLNRSVDNLKLYTLASPKEYVNLDTGLYDYAGRDVLRTTGVARYDGLKNNAEKTILITPTWRNYLASPNIAGAVRVYNSLFRDSDYFKIYNGLINNPRLLAAAKAYGYRITYLLHPATVSQIEDFGKSEYVDIVASTDNFSYEDALTKASLMVTDYSGVQFDFAYMYKPVVYYHPDELPPSYEEGFGYHLNTDALGEIVHKEDELVTLLIQYMKEGCEIHPEYRKRVDEFFYHHDHNNCERIYNAVQDYFSQKSNTIHSSVMVDSSSN